MQRGVDVQNRDEKMWITVVKGSVPFGPMFDAPSPQSRFYTLFAEEAIAAEVDELIQRQKEDGRWDTWYGISEGTKLEWAGIQTLWVLKVLKNYGRIEK